MQLQTVYINNEFCIQLIISLYTVLHTNTAHSEIYYMHSSQMQGLKFNFFQQLKKRMHSNTMWKVNVKAQCM